MIEIKREKRINRDAVRHVNDEDSTLLLFDESMAKEISGIVKYGDGFN